MAEKPQVYFGTDVTRKYFLPDKVQFFEHKKMNEGQKRLYESMTNNEWKMNQVTQEISMNMKLAEERRALFDVAVIAYKIYWGNAETIYEGRKINGSWDNPEQWEKVRDEMPSDLALEIQSDIIDLNNLIKKK